MGSSVNALKNDPIELENVKIISNVLTICGLGRGLRGQEHKHKQLLKRQNIIVEGRPQNRSSEIG